MTNYFIGVCAVCLQSEHISRDSDGHFYCLTCNGTVSGMERTREVMREPVEGSRLTSVDKQLLNQIDQAIAGFEMAHAGTLLRAYYADPSRAERTNRSLLFMHLGVMIGAVHSLNEGR